ncbi:prephenate dehydrogenase [uncultured Flavobacterium sp.]|uniref:prephenate dehydrogenase n=1 Tax=uncultured Flavobacterium sp. TaxID=165435 RepID=UPI0030CA1E58
MNIYIIGIGLIGGSMALDIKKKYDDAVICGMDSNKTHIEDALHLGIIDKKVSMDELDQADVVIVAVPVDIALMLLPQILDGINDNALVLDVGSTKSPICEAVAQHKRRRNFLATHPIAGTEFSGPKAAVTNLFKDKTSIICEIEKTAYKQQETALDLFQKLGIRIRYMEAKSHDKHIAYMSHLSHISSFMLGKTVIEKEKNERDIFDMAGSGFESTVRLAKSSPSMWTPIFKQNKANIIETLDEYILNLNHFKELLKNENFEELFNEMQNTNRIKEILK